MASSRRSASNVERTLRRALRDLRPPGTRLTEASLTEARPPQAGPPDAQRRARRWIVAFSGGLDSTVLLHACARVAGPANLVAAHVHHGLQQAANAWPAHCEEQAHALGVAFECLRLQGRPARGESVEAWAREHRYRGLAELARRARADAVLTAHHADDQVETVMMRVARGTGIDGLAGIEPVATLAGQTVVRPLLALRRAQLEAWAREHALRWVEDPSNQDSARMRNAVRHRLLPAIDAVTPGFREGLLAALPAVRAARDAQAALALDDLRRAGDGDRLDRRALRGLAVPRRHAALRAWLRELGLRMPGEAKLMEIERQLVDGSGAHGRVLHEGVALLRHRDAIEALEASRLACPPLPSLQLRWSGQGRIDLPDGHGRLLFEQAPAGESGSLNARWLAGQPLAVGPGGASAARLCPSRGAHRRTLKNLYQERAVPPWLRPLLPLVFVHGRLLHAGGLGTDCDDDWPASGECVSVRWQPDREDDPRWTWCTPTPASPVHAGVILGQPGSPR